MQAGRWETSTRDTVTDSVAERSKLVLVARRRVQRFVQRAAVAVLAVVHDFTREYPDLVVERSLSGVRVGREMDQIVELRGCCPTMIVSDNNIRLMSHTNLAQAGKRLVLWHYTAPEKLQQSRFVEASTAGSGTNA